MRKLATVRQITNITEIPDADAIETAWVDGWPVVVKKNDFSVGDWCVYFEPDSFVPHEIAPFLSRGNEPREHQGVQGERLRTVKLRKQLSQGLILPLGSLLGYDLSAALGVIKYEPPVHAYLSGSPRGNFPENIRKTDQERCLLGDTVISTEVGDLTIKEIVNAGLKVKVWTLNHETASLELNEITDWSVMSNQDRWLKVTLSNGQTITVTDNHQIWCSDVNAYVEAKDMQVGQLVIQKDD